MEDIFSLGEKWIKTVASSRVLTRSASGRPEVSYPNFRHDDTFHAGICESYERVISLGFR